METKNLSVNFESSGSLAAKLLPSEAVRQEEPRTEKKTENEGVPIRSPTEAEASHQVKPEELKKITSELNNKLKTLGTNAIRFQLDEATNKVVISVIDKKSHEVVKQIPSEEIQKLQEHLDGLKGILFDKMI